MTVLMDTPLIVLVLYRKYFKCFDEGASFVVRARCRESCNELIGLKYSTFRVFWPDPLNRHTFVALGDTCRSHAYAEEAT